jgi:uncharacterized protein (DUF1330 family)
VPKGYWIAHITITDPIAYKQYAATNQAAFKKYGGRVIVRGARESPGYPGAGRFEVRHGTMKDRHVVLEFDDYETALACYDSTEYQAAAKLRDQGAQVDVLVIEGSDPPC